MKKEDIHWDDWHRILFGAAPASFLLEVLIRTVIMYLILLVILRLMGKRMGGQLTISELAVMVTLGAIICVPMQIPDRGVVQGLFVIICALIFQRGFTWLGFKHSKWEVILQGKETILIKDGVIVVHELEKASISRQQLYGILRSQNIYNLGEVERLYAEACGLFSVYKAEEPKPGLSLFPPLDDGVHDVQVQPVEDEFVCRMCGNPAPHRGPQNEQCTNCGSKDWEVAIIKQTQSQVQEPYS
jgi:uncharacterized membrane protein YcaP (DUF421 family)